MQHEDAATRDDRHATRSTATRHLGAALSHNEAATAWALLAVTPDTSPEWEPRTRAAVAATRTARRASRFAEPGQESAGADAANEALDVTHGTDSPESALQAELWHERGATHHAGHAATLLGGIVR